jgi:hypothetical protein
MGGTGVANPLPETAGGHKEMSSNLADQWHPRIIVVYEPKCGGSANEYSCAHGALINFGDLTK